jgi:hypothetical protein
MKVFLSWAGDKSKAVAQLLEEWIQCVVQAAEPWVSTNIDSGAMWLSEIHEQLSTVKIGVICITKENKDKPWLLFEAGALAKSLPTNRICTVLIDLENTEILQPLAQFNHIKPTEEGMRKLITAINAVLPKPLPAPILNKVFAQQWPVFYSAFSQIKDLFAIYGGDSSAPQEITQHDIMMEILHSVRSFDNRITSLESKEQIIHEGASSVEQQAMKQIQRMFKNNFEPGDIKNHILNLYPMLSAETATGMINNFNSQMQ